MKRFPPEPSKILFFLALIFHWFLVDFGSILDAFFDDFSMILALLFRDVFLMLFSSFTNRFWNPANHEIIKNPLVFIGYTAFGTFRTQSIFRRFSTHRDEFWGLNVFRISRFSWKCDLHIQIQRLIKKLYAPNHTIVFQKCQVTCQLSPDIFMKV